MYTYLNYLDKNKYANRYVSKKRKRYTFFESFETKIVSGDRYMVLKS